MIPLNWSWTLLLTWPIAFIDIYGFSCFLRSLDSCSWSWRNHYSRGIYRILYLVIVSQNARSCISRYESRRGWPQTDLIQNSIRHSNFDSFQIISFMHLLYFYLHFEFLLFLIVFIKQLCLLSSNFLLPEQIPLYRLLFLPTCIIVHLLNFPLYLIFVLLHGIYLLSHLILQIARYFNKLRVFNFSHLINSCFAKLRYVISSFNNSKNITIFLWLLESSQSWIPRETFSYWISAVVI